MLDDVPGEILKGAGLPVFSPDSRHLAYGGETFDGRVVLVVDGIRIGEWAAKSMGDPTFSPDGRRVAVGLGFEEGGFLRKRSSFAMTVDGQIVQQAEAKEISRTSVTWWARRGTELLRVVAPA